MFIIKLLSQHVSRIIMPIIRRTRLHTAHDAAPHNHSQHNQCRTPYAVVHGLVLLMMGIMMAETCWDRSFDNRHRISCILLVSLSSPYVHDARSQEHKTYNLTWTMHGKIHLLVEYLKCHIARLSSRKVQEPLLYCTVCHWRLFGWLLCGYIVCMMLWIGK